MKSLPIFFVVIILTVILFLNPPIPPFEKGGQEGLATSESTPDVPDIFFENNRFDFGKIHEKEKAEHVFKYENRGDGRLIIKQVKTTCDCTAANADLKEIGPGGSGEIRVTYTATSKTGKFEKAVIVISNDPDTPHYALLIRGDVIKNQQPDNPMGLQAAELPYYGKIGGEDTALTIIFTGEDSGYLEPCGCSEDQLGGIPRRHTFLKSQIPNPKSQNIFPVSLGDLTNGFGRQSEIKMEITVQALEKMGYLAHNLGEKDIALGPEHLNYLSMENHMVFLSSNVRFVNHRGCRIHPFLIKHVVGAGLPRPYKIGFLGILSPELAETVPSSGFKITEPTSSLRPLIDVLKNKVDVLVLLSHAELDESIRLAETFPELDLVISGHGIDDPIDNKPVHIQNTTVVSAGIKGKYAGVYRYFSHKENGTIDIIPISSNYADSTEMKELLKQYLQRAKDENLLAYEPRMAAPSGSSYVGSNTCGICHKEVYKHWGTTSHSTAYETLVKSEHDYDPDCVPCHVTGFQYTSGFESPEKTPALKGVGCEDCHSPGSVHINTPLEEYGKTTTNTCLTCHIPDHSPKFEFTSYWKKIIHPEERISGFGG